MGGRHSIHPRSSVEFMACDRCIEPYTKRIAEMLIFDKRWEVPSGGGSFRYEVGGVNFMDQGEVDEEDEDNKGDEDDAGYSYKGDGSSEDEAYLIQLYGIQQRRKGIPR